jgi:endonuclease G, mitochondrial
VFSTESEELEVHDFGAAQQQQNEAAARRVADATESRRAKLDALRKKGRTRKVIGTQDFLGVGYLASGAAAARAVGRVVIREDGQLAGYGTGSLVSPSLLLTNHHVLPSAQVAKGSSIEFSFEDGSDGKPLTPRSFELDPGRFFLADEELDFALVAIRATSEELADFGFNPPIAGAVEGVVGEFVTIVQHPRGEKKQIALRENRIVDVLDLFLHYEADTEPGSSGSPVFNDRWQVVSLHHASVPAPEHGELGGFVNEGIRMHGLREFVRARGFSPAEQALVDELFQ